MFTVAVLGPVEVRRDGERIQLPSGKTTEVLVRLALEAGLPVRADLLLQDLWEDTGTSAGKNTLQSKVSQLRRALGQPDLISSGNGGYTLGIDPDRVDALRVVGLATSATALLRSGDCAAALEVSTQGLALFRGDVLGAAGDGPWLYPHRARLEQIRMGLMEDQLAARVELGAGADVIGELEALVQRYPLREALWYWLITALYRNGRQAEALEAYGRVRKALVAELGLEPGRDLQELEKQVLQQSLAGPNRDPASAPPPSIGNLPGLSSPLIGAFSSSRKRLIGREPDLSAVLAELEEHRLVTLVGTPGVGKTRVAIEVARRIRVPGGIWLIRLDALDAATSISQAVAETLNLSGEHALFERLATSETLLVFDNCEHVVDPAAELIGRLLDRTSRLRVLATSQLPLGLDGETVYPLAPLPLAGSIQLFTDRSIAARPRLELDVEATKTVAELCVSLDGLPLAIELAAARMKSLSVQEIARRLDHRFALLQDPTSRRPARRRALAAAIGWSYDLLFPDDQRALWALSCFSGGAPLDAAEQVLNVLGVPMAAADDAISRLVDRSLVQVDVAAHGVVRYRLLDSIRAFAVDRLQETAWYDDALAAHAEWLAEAAERCAATVRGPDQPRCLALVRQERANIDAALAWTAQHRPALGMRIANGFGWTWVVLGDGVAGAERVRAALSAATSGAVPPDLAVTPPDRALALLLAGWLEASAGHLDRAESELNQALHIAEEMDGLGPTPSAAGLVADAARHLAFLHLQQRRPDLALARTDQSVGIDRSLGRSWEVAAGLLLGASAAIMLGEIGRGIQAADEALRLLAPLEDSWGLVHGQAMLGAIAQADGRFDDAARYLAQAAAASRQLGFLGQAAYHLTRLGRVQQQAGDLEAAGQTLGDAIEAAHRDGDLRMAATANINLARVLHAKEQSADAVALLHQSDEWYRQSGGGDGALLTRALLVTMSAPGGGENPRPQLESILDEARGAQNHEVEDIAVAALARLADPVRG